MPIKTKANNQDISRLYAALRETITQSERARGAIVQDNIVFLDQDLVLSALAKTAAVIAALPPSNQASRMARYAAFDNAFMDATHQIESLKSAS